jgi:mRNA interferase MazF/mRNA interferase ChpB
MYVPEKGDIVTLNFDPSSGNEIMKRRPAFVISKKMFNEHTGFVIVAPITSTIRNIKLEVVLTNNNKINGSVLVYQMKSIDFKSRKIKFVEQSSPSTLKKVNEIASVIVQ